MTPRVHSLFFRIVLKTAKHQLAGADFNRDGTPVGISRPSM